MFTKSFWTFIIVWIFVSGLAHGTPLPVLKSSYENKIAASIIGPQTLTTGTTAYADFFQDGTYSAVSHTFEYNPSNWSTSNKFGHIHFWQKINGNWVDKTSKLLTDTVGCLHPRKILIADFNNDGKPDIFLACHGFDADPFPGEQPHMLLSQPDGSYKNITLPITCYCHSASAADFSNTGYADILVGDPGIYKTPFFLINNKDGTFTPDYNRLSADVQPFSFPYQTIQYGRQIYTVELIDFNHDGKYDLFLAGAEPTSGQPITMYWSTSIYLNDWTNNFKKTPIILPNNQNHGLVLDIVYDTGNIYLLRVDFDYNTSAIQKITYPSMTSQIIYQHNGAYPGGMTWIDWIIPYSGNIVSMNAAYNVSVPSGIPTVVEFYNTTLDNYFITADAGEASAIDTGMAGPGWARTGNSFHSGGTTSVCRFYGSQSPGPNSHFYTVSQAECNYLKQLQASTPATEKRWNFESLDFLSTPPTGQTCPANTTPVYRAYNNGFARGVDSNHRITSNIAAINEVVARGWSNEGVVMCAP